jgi:hypothetical protein
MSPVDLYRTEKALARQRRAPIIEAAREIFERLYPPTRQDYTATNAAYFQANKARIYAARRARNANRRPISPDMTDAAD